MGVTCYQWNLSKAVRLFFLSGRRTAGDRPDDRFDSGCNGIYGFYKGMSCPTWSLSSDLLCSRIIFHFWAIIPTLLCLLCKIWERDFVSVLFVTIDIKHLDAGIFFQIVLKWSACRASEQPWDNFGKDYLPGRGLVMLLCCSRRALNVS